MSEMSEKTRGAVFTALFVFICRENLKAHDGLGVFSAKTRLSLGLC